MTTGMKHRITALERWGYREQTPYTLEQLRKLRDVGYSSALVNGGSGMGPDESHGNANSDVFAN